MTARTPPLYVWGGGAKRRATSATTWPTNPNAALMRPDHGQCSADFVPLASLSRQLPPRKCYGVRPLAETSPGPVRKLDPALERLR
jgi:hypothetical protein